MLHLRKQVDRIDQRLLRLLQQRTKLSGEIGRTKRRHGAEIYVPDRERELLARVAKLAKGTLPPAAAGAIFREILSSSRAAQGQAPIGVLRRSAAQVLPAARGHFGACDRFITVEGWPELKKELLAENLTIGLLTQADFAGLWRTMRDSFPGELQVMGEMAAPREAGAALASRIYLIRPAGPPRAGNRALILIECKPGADAVNILSAMPRVPKLIQLTPLPGRGRVKASLVALTFARPVTEESLVVEGRPVGTLLGIYTSDESYGG